MIIYGLMKYIERIPLRYDLMMNLLTLGALSRGHARLLSHVRDGMRVLEIGCGTGLFAAEAARRGARVTALDANPQMLAILSAKVAGRPEASRLELHECGCAGLAERFHGRTFDLVVASMMLGELPPPVARKLLADLPALLAPGGRLLVSDELWPESAAGSLAYHLLFWLFFIPNFILTRTLIIPVKGLPDRMREAGLAIVSRERLPGSAVTLLVARADPR